VKQETGHERGDAVMEGIFPVLETATQYQAAFPHADLNAIQVHLLFGTVGTELSQRINSFLTEVGWPMSVARFSILRLLFLCEDHQLTQSEIARALRYSPGNVTQLVDGLVREGLVQRIPSETSRRVTLARLTEDGKDCAKTVVPAMLDFMLRTCSNLSEADLLQLTTLIRKFLVGVKTA
jgi:DNA-binding MarR family transcriptional regulator